MIIHVYGGLLYTEVRINSELVITAFVGSVLRPDKEIIPYGDILTMTVCSKLLHCYSSCIYFSITIASNLHILQIYVDAVLVSLPPYCQMYTYSFVFYSIKFYRQQRGNKKHT